MTHSLEKRIETVPTEVQTLNLLYKDYINFLKYGQRAKETMTKSYRNQESDVSTKTINKETEILKRNQTEKLLLKSIITEIKNSLENLSSTSEQTVSKLENRLTEII